MTGTTKTTRVDDAYERLRVEILENRMPPGFQATEPEIALRLGMSRTPVREALLKLEADGLIELIPRRGARVLPVLPDDMREIYEILTALEPEAAAKLARSKPSKDFLKGLHKSTTAMEKSLQKEDLDSWALADDEFHRKLLSLHGNKRMIAFVNTLFDQVRRARMMTLRLREPPVRSTQEHRDILNYILEGNEDMARETFRLHRQRASAELLNILEHYRIERL